MHSINGTPHKSTQTLVSPKRSGLVKPKPFLTPTTPAKKRKASTKQNEISDEEVKKKTMSALKRRKSATDADPVKNKGLFNKLEATTDINMSEDEEEEEMEEFDEEDGEAKATKTVQTTTTAPIEPSLANKTTERKEVPVSLQSTETSSILTPEEVEDLYEGIHDIEFNSFFREEIERHTKS